VNTTTCVGASEPGLDGSGASTSCTSARWTCKCLYPETGLLTYCGATVMRGIRLALRKFAAAAHVIEAGAPT
jgi:hypothetical protein